MATKNPAGFPPADRRDDFAPTEPSPLPGSARTEVKSQEESFVGFPDINYQEEDLATRPSPLHEIPVQARIDREMDVIRRHHDRIAKAIDTFWGHRDCMEYLQKLILSGGDGVGKTRVGFKAEVLAALINLSNLHEEEYK